MTLHATKLKMPLDIFPLCLYHDLPMTPTQETRHPRRFPAGFIFSLKIPRTITHEKVLIDCDKEFEEFVDAAHVLGEKLGPIVFQFPNFNKDSFSNPIQFFSRLRAFMKKLPRIGPYKFAVGIRNKWWLTPRFADLLRENNVALVLQDHAFMPSVERVFSTIDPITADFVYIRLLGDRKAIEAKTTVWNSIIEDRTASMTSWVEVCQMVQRRGMPQYVYFNSESSVRRALISD
jgi:uncharacterized protein YecE (DUF72 family)